MLPDALAIKQLQAHYAAMSQGYMVVAEGKPLVTTAKWLFKISVPGFGIKLRTSV